MTYYLLGYCLTYRAYCAIWRSAACSPSSGCTTSPTSVLQVLQVLQINRLHYHQLWYTNATPSHPTSSTLTCAAKSPRASLPKRRDIQRCICDEHSKDLPESLNCLVRTAKETCRNAQTLPQLAQTPPNPRNRQARSRLPVNRLAHQERLPCSQEPSQVMIG